MISSKASKGDRLARRKILKELYKVAVNHPRAYISKEDLMKKLKISARKLDFNIYYLEKKGLVRLEYFLGGHFLAQITVYGIDVVESL